MDGAVTQHIQNLRISVIINLILGVVVLILGVIITLTNVMNSNKFRTFEDAKPLLNRLQTFQFWSLAALGFNILSNVFKTIFMSKENETYVKLSFLVDYLKSKSVLEPEFLQRLESIKNTNIFQIGR